MLNQMMLNQRMCTNHKQNRKKDFVVRLPFHYYNRDNKNQGKQDIPVSKNNIYIRAVQIKVIFYLFNRASISFHVNILSPWLNRIFLKSLMCQMNSSCCQLIKKTHKSVRLIHSAKQKNSRCT